MELRTCPTCDELAEFVIGNLSGPAFTRIAGHVEHCAVCETALQGLDGRADSLLKQLRQLSAAEVSTDTAPPELLAAARSARSRGDRRVALTIPRRLGKFELLEELGVGTFGYVFRARDTELDRMVAVKILRAGGLASHDDVDRFLREARSAARLKHPGIVAMYETGQTEDGTCYLVEEFIQGTTLAQRSGTGAFGFRQAAQLVADVAEALHYAHEHGVIHRDVKPSNILLEVVSSQLSVASGDRSSITTQLTTDHGQLTPRLTDFGLAKREADETPMTLDGQVLGTPAYMSPEQARGESHDVDARSDIYSLGVVLYELLTGERPFRGNRRMLILQVLHDEPRPPRQLNDKIPRDLETICLKAMAKSAARRYATARDLAEDLRRYLSGEPIHARPVGKAERLWRWCRRNPVAASLLVAVTVGSAAGLWYLSDLSKHFVRSTALTSAAQQAEMLEVFNNHYADVVERAGFNGVEASSEYAENPLAIPLPATLTIEMGRELSECGKSGMQVRLYSDFPFRTRKDGGPKDDFEWEALRRLREKPDEPVHRFENIEGRPSLRYAVARRMKQSCIDCHNHHPDSTKTDWEPDDVRGVLEIIRPLDRDIAQTQEGLRGSFILMAVISMSLLGLSGLVLFVGNRRRN